MLVLCYINYCRLIFVCYEVYRRVFIYRNVMIIKDNVDYVCLCLKDFKIIFLVYVNKLFGNNFIFFRYFVINFVWFFWFFILELNNLINMLMGEENILIIKKYMINN